MHDASGLVEFVFWQIGCWICETSQDFGCEACACSMRSALLALTPDSSPSAEDPAAQELAQQIHFKPSESGAAESDPAALAEGDASTPSGREESEGPEQTINVHFTLFMTAGVPPSSRSRLHGAQKERTRYVDSGFFPPVQRIVGNIFWRAPAAPHRAARTQTAVSDRGEDAGLRHLPLALRGTRV
ncbi:hypothetical protein EYF80_058454 [Liparis tanakae]|uniref:Uncharacterized protein n=1 Tax=Liparis tanakae TaxID=230148 RepID=A0A4Z2ESQ0_9TELE|nr:hypothetical protein EYF80_058454 [Liparis tanakae]